MMVVDSTPAPTGPISASAQPVSLSEKQSEVCRRLDDFYAAAKREDVRPSDMFRGALHSIDPLNRANNPDWMAQAAHSFRELLYPFWESHGRLRKEKAFAEHGTVGDVGSLTKSVGGYYGFVTSVSHHNWDQARRNPIAKSISGVEKLTDAQVFELVAFGFEGVLFAALRRQLDAHVEIDNYIAAGTRDVSLLRELLGVNFDARQYFFAQGNNSLFDWLRDHGFLDPIKGSSAEQLPITYRTPELNYLTKVAETCPQGVVDFILATSIDVSQPNLEVIDRFAWICQSLPADQLARVIPKLRDENWIGLISGLRQTGFGYGRLFERLTNERDFATTVALAEAVLAVRPKDVSGKSNDFLFDPFYIDDLENTKVFESLAEIDETGIEPALALGTKIFGQIISLSNGDQPPFAAAEPFSLYNKDLFNIEIGDREYSTYRASVEDLAALIVLLARRCIGSSCDDPPKAKRLYETYFVPLADCRSVWTLRLYAMSLCPAVFAGELQKAFFRIFESSEPTLLTAGAEYYHALRAGFGALPAGARAEYIARVFEEYASDAKLPPAKNMAWRILSSIDAHLSDGERDQAAKVLGKPLNSHFSPGPAIERAQGGFVSPKGPIDLDALSAISVPDLVEQLKGDWSPARLNEQALPEDFLNPLSGEGMGRLLKADMRKRPQEYLDHALSFFDLDKLDPHYTHSFLRGVIEAMRDDVNPVSADWGGLVPLLVKITESGKLGALDRNSDVRESSYLWLAGWEAIHKVMAEAVEQLLKDKNGKAILDVAHHRAALVSIISYLIEDRDPTTEKERKDNASDPFTNAINSIRGEALQALVSLIYRDAANSGERQQAGIAADLKAIYEKCLRAEPTMAVKFLIGYLLPDLYWRDPPWVADLLPEMFPASPDRKDLRFAAWEGYVTKVDLDRNLFHALEGYYEQAIATEPAEYTRRRYHTELDEGLARHLAIAFVYEPSFEFDTPLFQKFWQTKGSSRHCEFVECLARQCVLRPDISVWAAANKSSIEKIKTFWEWALINCDEADTLSSFGYWMKADANVFDQTWLAEHILQTLKKTGGAIDWSFGVIQSLRVLATVAPEAVLEILRLHLERGRIDDPSRPGWVYVDDDLVNTFRVLSGATSTKEGTRKLINDLLPLGNGQFWRLKEAL